MARPVQQWSLVLALMCVASLVESIGISQVFAFLPLYIAGIVDRRSVPL